jgi:hypothetical protein
MERLVERARGYWRHWRHWRQACHTRLPQTTVILRHNDTQPPRGGEERLFGGGASMTAGLPRLDRIDLRILATLQRNGRITNLELADAVGLSASPCLVRVKRLEKAGYISGYGAEIQMQKLGDTLTIFTEGNCSPRLAGDVGWRVCGQRLAQGVERGAAVGLGGADDGAEGGIGLGARLRAEAVGDFAEDHARPQRPFGDADEPVLTIAGDTAAQPLGSGAPPGWRSGPIVSTRASPSAPSPGSARRPGPGRAAASTRPAPDR